MTKRNPEFGGFSACFAVRAGTDRKGKATPPARTETDWAQTYTAALHGFQPTPPARTETSGPFVNVAGVKRFQPTPPARTETESIEYHEGEMEISTHSAREDGDLFGCMPDSKEFNFNPLRPRGRRQQYYTKKPTILHHISTIKSHHTPSNHRQPALHTSKTVLTVQFFRCESPRKFMFASGSHQTI